MSLSGLAIKKNIHFIGRRFEIQRLNEIEREKESAAIIVIGRRRVGKTELLKQFYREKLVLMFEGVQLRKKRKLSQKDHVYQMEMVLHQLSKYTQNEMYKKLKPKKWIEVFEAIVFEIKKEPQKEIVLYFEEVQWLANYQDFFFAEFKYIWDHELKNLKKTTTLFCGSSPSFLTSQLLSNKAFYNRSQHEIHLKPFSIQETIEFFGASKSKYEVMIAYLLVNGIPEYLKYLKKESSIFLSILKNSFLPSSFFSLEKEKIFVSSLSESPHFQGIIQYLATKKYATRNQIIAHLKATSGKNISQVLNELIKCGFILEYDNLSDKTSSYLKRFAIADEYLHYYFKFIYPKLAQIQNGDYNKNFSQCIELSEFYQFLGYAFERFCRKNHSLIAQKLGFSAVKYKSGSYFHRGDDGHQIDLLFIRKDLTLTLCECKFQQNSVNSTVIKSFTAKEEYLKENIEFRNYSIQRVLISVNGADKKLEERYFFDQIITLDDFL